MKKDFKSCLPPGSFFQLPAAEAVDLVSGEPQPAVLGDHLRVQPRHRGMRDAPLLVGRVGPAVVLYSVDFDDDAGAVRGQEQEVHPLPVQRAGLLAAPAPRRAPSA